MNITTVFSIADTVFKIEQLRKETHPTCASCSGRGRVTLDDLSTTRCPTCWGNGHTTLREPTAWLLAGELTIGEVRGVITNATGGESSHTRHHVPGADETKIEYMAYETGIGTGTLHQQPDLFATEAEALAACSLRNAEVDHAKT